MNVPKTKTAPKEKPLAAAWEHRMEDYVQDLAWSADGRFLAAVDVSGNLTLWNGADGAERHRIRGHALGCCSLAWNPDCNLLATGGQDGKVRLWDAESGKTVETLGTGQGWVERVAWSHDGSLLAFSQGRKLALWSEDGIAPDPFPPQASTIADLAWNPGAMEVATACYGGVSIFTPGKNEAMRQYPWKGSCLSVAWSPDGRYIASGQQDNCVHFWRTRDGKDSQMHGYPTKVREIAWDSLSRYLATGGSDEVTVWDCSGKGPAGTKPICLQGHEGLVTALAFHGSLPLVASGGLDTGLVIWDMARREGIRQAFLDDGITRAAWRSGADPWIAAGDEAGTVGVFHLEGF